MGAPGAWQWLEVSLDGRAGKLCVSPSILQMGEAELMQASEVSTQGTPHSVSVAFNVIDLSAVDGGVH